MNPKRFSESKARRNGFYLALAVCLVAVGIAAWSTFDAVSGYISATNPENPDPASSMSDDPEAPRSPVPTPSNAAQPTPTPRPAATPQPAAPTPRPSAPAAPTAEPTTDDSSEETEPQVPANAPLYELSTEFIYPVESKEVAKAYSSGAPVYSATMKDWRVHVGTDLSAESGADVMACGNGIVKETYTDKMLGNVALIEHGDYEFYYCGLGENFLVEPGDVVTAGQTIGTITAVPAESADQPHLHLEVRRDSAYLDPRSVIDGIN